MSATRATSSTARPYPRVFDNGGGERVTIRAHRVENGRDWLEVDSEVLPGAGPMMHRHPRQEEILTVQSGTLGYLREGEPPRTAGIGETVIFARGVSHRFWNAGQDVLRCSGRISPPLRFEYWIEQLFASMAEHGGKRPGIFDIAYLLHHFAAETETTGIPTLVQRVVFPMVRVVGTVTGRYTRYRDKPELVGEHADF